MMPAIVNKIRSYVQKGVGLCYKKEWKLFYAGYIAAGILLLASAGLLLVADPGDRTRAGSTGSARPPGNPAAVSADAALERRENHKDNIAVTTPAAETKASGTAALDGRSTGENAAVAEKPPKVYWPLTGSVKTEFGWQLQPVYQEWRFHPGIDIAGKDQTEQVKSMYDGTVTDIYTDPATGLTVAVTHGKDTVYYGALTAVQVEKGMTVKAGQGIGTPGASAAEPFPHVHLVIKREGKTINPLDLLH